MRERGRKSARRTAEKRKPTAEKDAPVDIDKIFEEGTEIDRAFDRAIREALLMHKRAGNPVPIWKDGRVVWIPPHKIRV